MAFIEWNNRLSVNVVEIDNQHKVLVSMINKLHEAMLQGEGNNILGNIISGLISYAGTHFKTEERYFEQFGYPEANSHKQEHSDFAAKFSDLKEEFEKGKIGMSLEVMHYLRDWLRRHISDVDKRYSAFFNENGLK